MTTLSRHIPIPVPLTGCDLSLALATGVDAPQRNAGTEKWEYLTSLKPIGSLPGSAEPPRDSSMKTGEAGPVAAIPVPPQQLKRR